MINSNAVFKKKKMLEDSLDYSSLLDNIAPLTPAAYIRKDSEQIAIAKKSSVSIVPCLLCPFMLPNHLLIERER